MSERDPYSRVEYRKLIAWGGFDGAPFDPEESQDLVLVARRR